MFPKIESDPSIIRAFLPTHHHCNKTMTINAAGLQELYKNKSSLFLSDKEVDRLWNVLQEGL